MHEGEQLPAKVMHAKKAAYVSYNGKEILKTDYEVSLKYIQIINVLSTLSTPFIKLLLDNTCECYRRKLMITP